jgi:TonB family protein
MRPTLAILAFIATTMPQSQAVAAQPANNPPTLKTTVSVLVGQPDLAQPKGPGMTIPTGTVIVPTSGNAPSPERFMRARKELRGAYRLGALDSPSSEDFTLTPDAELLVATVTKTVTTKATLLSFDDTTAVYRVRLLENGKEAAAPTVSVKRGQWAIVGGRDGAEAPYFFVLLRPCTLEEIAEEARWKDVSRPKLVGRVMPEYPEEARKAGTEGVVVLDCLVEKDGAVKDIRVQEGTEPSLNQAAIEAVRQWHYEPAKNSKDQPVAVRMSVTISFWLS